MHFVVRPNGQVDVHYNAAAVNQDALKQIVGDDPSPLSNIVERSLDYIGDQLAQMCRTDKASEIGGYLNGLTGRNVTMQDRAWNGFWLAAQPIWFGGQVLLAYVKLEIAIDAQIAQSDHPQAYALLKEVLIALALKWFANNPSKQKKLTDEIIPLVVQKMIEQRVYQALRILYEALSSLAASSDDDSEMNDRIGDVIDAIEMHCPHLRDILNNEFVQIGAYFAGAQMVSRPCESLVNALRTKLIP
jgi:hypothetical protein